MRGATVRSILRQETREAHRRLDDTVAPLDLARRADYAMFLAASTSALLPLEALLGAAGMAGILPDWPTRQRGEALLADLSAFGAGASPPPLPAQALTQAELFGAAYVLEGSRLGAKLLLQQVQASADPLVTGNTRYLTHGEGQRFWQSFLAALEEAPAAPADVQDMIEGALLAFGVFERAFKPSIGEALGKASIHA